MTMTKQDPEREERRREQAEIAESLTASGALDEIFAWIDAGEPLTGHAGLLKGMLKAQPHKPQGRRFRPEPIYQAANADGSLIELEAFAATPLGRKYPSECWISEMAPCVTSRWPASSAWRIAQVVPEGL